MPECGRRAPGPRRMRIARRDVPPRLRRRVVLSAVARYAVGSVPIGRLAGIRTWRCVMSEFLRAGQWGRSEEHTSELQSRQYLVCRLLLEKKKTARDNLQILTSV